MNRTTRIVDEHLKSLNHPEYIVVISLNIVHILINKPMLMQSRVMHNMLDKEPVCYLSQKAGVKYVNTCMQDLFIM